MDVSLWVADHVCWRTETNDEYQALIETLRTDDHFQLLIESEVGGRLIATFQLATPIRSSTHKVDVVEIPSPKAGRPYSRGLEHVEFVIPSPTKDLTSPWNDEKHQQAFQHLQAKHPDVKWNTKATQKEINPDLSVQVEGVGSAKFHLVALKDVIEAEKDTIK